jgi:hypothetical protein
MAEGSQLLVLRRSHDLALQRHIEPGVLGLAAAQKHLRVDEVAVVLPQMQSH